MARAQETDFLSSMRFHVDVVPVGNGQHTLRTGGNTPQAGFTNVSTPELTVDPAEYKEGQMVYTRKFPGNPSVSDITMSRGVARADSSFWDWARVVVEGSGDYRATVSIKHYHRDTSLTRGVADRSLENKTDLDLNSPARVYKLYEAFPVRHKVAADLDGTASEISIMELDVTYESFEIEES